MYRAAETRTNVAGEKKTCEIGKFFGYVGDGAEENAGMGWARYACNVRIEAGKVFSAHGVERAQVGSVPLPDLTSKETTIVNVTFFNRYDSARDAYDPYVLFHGADGELYASPVDEEDFFRLGVSPEGDVEFLKYRADSGDWILAFDEAGKIICYNGYVVTQYSCPPLKGLSVYKGRVFGVERNDATALRCGGVGDLSEWYDEEAGAYVVYFNDGEGGALRRTLVCGDNLYVFRDHAVYKFTGYADLNDYVLTEIFASGGKVYADTAAVVGDSVFFAAEDGVYSIKGGEVTRRFRQPFTLLVDGLHACGAAYDGRYFVAAKYETEGTPIADESSCAHNNGLLACDPVTGGTEYIRGAEIVKLLPASVDGKKYLFLMNAAGGARSAYLGMLSDSGKIYGQTAEKRWRSPTVSIGGPHRVRAVRKLFVRTPKALTVAVTVDGTTVTKELPGKTQTQIVPIHKTGEDVSVYFASREAAFTLKPFGVEYELFERRGYGAN